MLSIALLAVLAVADPPVKAPVPAAGAAAKKPRDRGPGRSHIGDAFDEGPRQAARLFPGCGDVILPVTTAVPAAQAFCSQGLAQLHGFWYLEAERSFRHAAALDPEC